MTTEDPVLERPRIVLNHKIEETPRQAPPTPKKFNLRLAALVAAGILAATAITIAWLRGRNYESTDDAFVEGRVIPIAAKVDGYVTSLKVDDNQRVKAGDVIATIDPRDYEAALGEARSAVAAAEARTTDARSRLSVYRAQIDQARAELAAAEAGADFTRLDAARYRALSRAAASEQDRERTGSAEAEAVAKVAGAKSRVAAAQFQSREAEAAVAVAEAEVRAAQSRLQQPELNLAYTRVIAPQSGRIARRTVEQGAYVRQGQTLLAIVADDLWVTANFKETQLARMRPGQRVTLKVDARPGHAYTGWVDSLQPGTGGRFSLLPPENATGNFVKVVQRIPVKIRLDAASEDAGFELSPGMSVVPEVTVR